MSNMKAIKELAVIVGAVAGIATGIEKTRLIVSEWAIEYRNYKDSKASKDSSEKERTP